MVGSASRTALSADARGRVERVDTESNSEYWLSLLSFVLAERCSAHSRPVVHF